MHPLSGLRETLSDPRAEFNYPPFQEKVAKIEAAFAHVERQPELFI